MPFCEATGAHCFKRCVEELQSCHHNGRTEGDVGQINDYGSPGWRPNDHPNAIVFKGPLIAAEPASTLPVTPSEPSAPVV